MELNLAKRARFERELSYRIIYQGLRNMQALSVETSRFRVETSRFKLEYRRVPTQLAGVDSDIKIITVFKIIENKLTAC